MRPGRGPLCVGWREAARDAGGREGACINTGGRLLDSCGARVLCRASWLLLITPLLLLQPAAVFVVVQTLRLQPATVVLVVVQRLFLFLLLFLLQLQLFLLLRTFVSVVVATATVSVVVQRLFLLLLQLFLLLCETCNL